MTTREPLPGTDEAKKKGCPCPLGILTGTAELGGPVEVWNINPNCPIHTKPESWYGEIFGREKEVEEI